MKLKDFFSQLKSQGKISLEDYDKFIEGVPEHEMPDVIEKAISERFMTAERAAANPEIAAKIRHGALDPLDKDIKKMLEVINGVDKYKAMEIAKLTRQGDQPDTYKQSMALAEYLPTLVEKLKVAPNDEEAKKKLADQQRVIEELTQKFTGVEKEKETWKKNVEAEYSKREKDYKINGHLENMARSYTFAEAHEKVRPLLTKAILGELKSSNLFDLTMNEENEVLGVFESKDGVMSPKFNGNNPVTAQSLLDEKFKPFLKQNGTDSSDSQMKTHQIRVDTTPNQNNQLRRGASVSAEV
jgi:hypothetical protein